MDSLCRRLEDLAGQLSQSINKLSQPSGAIRAKDTANEDLLQAAQVLKSMPGLRDSFHPDEPAITGALPDSKYGLPNGYTDRNPAANVNASYHVETSGQVDSGDEEDDLDSDLQSEDSVPGYDVMKETNRAGAMVKDSYGHLR